MGIGKCRYKGCFIMKNETNNMKNEKNSGSSNMNDNRKRENSNPNHYIEEKNTRNILIYNEGRDEKLKPEVLDVYPEGIGEQLKNLLSQFPGCNILDCISMYDVEEKMNEDLLEKADVLVYWSHGGNGLFPEEVAKLIGAYVLRGLGFVVLHSAIGCKAFKSLMGTTCSIHYRHDDFERMTCCNPVHPIAAGLPLHIELEKEESYGEFIDVPTPDDIIYLGWFDSGEVCRSVMTWSRGYGKIVFIQPGHETNPSYKNPWIQKLIYNSCIWASRSFHLPEVPTDFHQKTSLEELRKKEV